MILNPKIGQNVILWYRKSLKNKYHGKNGIVVISSKGKPRNHGINIDGVIVVVPCGNIQLSNWMDKKLVTNFNWPDNKSEFKIKGD